MAEAKKTSTVDDIKIAFSRLRWIRLIITIFLVGWLGFFTYLMMRSYQDQGFFDSNQPSTSKAATSDTDSSLEDTKYFYLHRIWFGDYSIVLILFQVWYMTIMLFLLGPLVREGIRYLQRH